MLTSQSGRLESRRLSLVRSLSGHFEVLPIQILDPPSNEELELAALLLLPKYCG